MDDRDHFKFRVTPLTAENYFAWSNDIEVVLRGKGLWKYVKPDVDCRAAPVRAVGQESETTSDAERETQNEVDEQKQDMALAYLLTSIDSTCKAMVRKMRCPREVWNTLREMFQSVSEAALDSKLSQLQSISLKRGEKIVEYSNKILGLVGELESAGYTVSKVEQKHALLRGLPKEFDVTAEAIMISEQNYNQAVAKLIVRETRLEDLEIGREKAMATKGVADTRTCHNCGKLGHLAKNCWHKKKERDGRKDKRTCFICGKPGHIAKYCRQKGQNINSGDRNETTMVNFPVALMSSPSKEMSEKWMLDSGCTSHISNNRSFFRTFLEKKGSIQVGNHEFIESHGVGTVNIKTAVHGVLNNVVLHDVLYAPDIVHNLISVSKVRRKNFRVIVDNDEKDPHRGSMMFIEKSFDDVKLIGLETSDGMYEAVLRVEPPVEAHLIKSSISNLWNQRPGHCSDEVLKASVPHVICIDIKRC